MEKYQQFTGLQRYQIAALKNNKNKNIDMYYKPAHAAELCTRRDNTL